MARSARRDWPSARCSAIADGDQGGVRFTSPLEREQRAIAFAHRNVDDVLGFVVADDSLYLDRDIFTSVAADGPLAAAAFRSGTAAADADDRILYDSITGHLLYDADGLGGTAAVLFATVTAGTALTNADFVAY